MVTPLALRPPRPENETHDEDLSSEGKTECCPNSGFHGRPAPVRLPPPPGGTQVYL